MTRRHTRHGADDAYLAARWVPPEPTPLDPRAVRLGTTDTLARQPISVANPSRWASAACQPSTPQQRAGALAEYAVHLAGRPDLIELARTELAGANLACPCAPDLRCHRDILLDFAQPPADPYRPGGHALAVTLPRPWASLVLLPDALAPNVVHTRSWCTDYRGALCVIASRRLDEHGVASAEEAGCEAAWHARQSGWLGAAVLVDIHPVTRGCCPPWGQLPGQHRPGLYHWVWQHGARLARPVCGHGFLGLHPVSWSVLVRRSHPKDGPSTP